MLRETLVIRQPLYRSIHINSAEAEEEKITESGDRDEGKHSAASVKGLHGCFYSIIRENLGKSG